MRFCTRCGASLQAQQAFCTACGERAPSPADATTAMPAGPPAPPGAPTPPNPWAPAGPTDPTVAVVPPAAPDPTVPGASALPPAGSPMPPGPIDPSGGFAPAPAPPAGGAGHGRRNLLLVGLGVLVLAGVGFFVFRGTTGGGGGADSPEGAVRALADAVSNEDPAGMADAMAPDEVRTLSDLIGTAEGRAQRAGVADDASPYRGLDVRVADLKLETTKLADDVVRVDVVDGQARWSVDRTQLTDQVRGVLGGDDQGTITRDDLVAHTRDRRDRRVEVDPFLIAVRRNGGWYVSPVYTAVAWLAEADGLPQGDFATELPEGLAAADSPEAAVRHLADTIDDVDPETTLRDLPGDEWSALWVYRDAVRQLVRDAKDDGSDFTFSVDQQRLRTSDLPGGRKKVTIEGASGRSTTTDGDGEVHRYRWTLDGLCLRVRGDDDREDCLDESDRARSLLKAADLRAPFVVVEQDRGGWVVSPMATLLEYGREILPKVSDAQLYEVTNTEVLAPATATIRPGATTKVRINDGGFARVDLLVTAGSPHLVVTRPDDAHLDGVTVYGPDGDEAWREFSRYGGSPTPAGRYRLVIRGDVAKTGSIRVGAIPVTDLPSSGKVSGTLDAGTPARDYRFLVSEADTYSVTASGDTEVWVFDDKGEEVDCYDGCDLEADATYRARVGTYDESGTTRFTLQLGRRQATIDGGTVATGEIVDGEDATHHVVVPDGVTAEVDLRGDTDAADLDLYCADDSCASSRYTGTSTESITITGPFDGDVLVHPFAGGGESYRLSITVRSGG